MLGSLKKTAVSSLPAGLRNGLRKARALAHLAWRDIRYDMLGSAFPLKPRAISMMANDICNSRCQMCLIWERKKDHEITPAELEQILAEPLFSKVGNIGVTGGEPTLRKDLPELFDVIARRQPKIGSASMITNAIRGKEVEQQVFECSKVCRDHGVGFSVMVSLDGLGEVHDTVRGRPGNFATAVGCLERFRAAGIPVSFGCTITKSNLAYVDELMDWAQENEIYGRFRVAEFIDRLYNAPQKEFIRCFSDLEKFHLGLFFFRAEHEFETDPSVQKTYRSIRGMLAEGKPRTTGCPYHYDTVILTSRGELLYCSPKSPILGSILARGSAAKVYFGNLNKRAEIRQKHCDDCIHDYHVPVTFREKVGFYLKHRDRARRFDCECLVKQAERLSAGISRSEPLSPASQRVLIVGWYGTETTGDKAILATIVERLKGRQHPPTEITVASLHPFVTRYTLPEIGHSDLRIVETFGREFIDACQTADEVVIGGGPLMDLEILNHILFAFITVRMNDGLARVEGCGLGPLDHPRYIAVVRQIVRLANEITLRDKKSVARCKADFERNARVVDDPATDFIRAWMANTLGLPAVSAPAEATDGIACFLREWGQDYGGGLSAEDFNLKKTAFESGLERLLAQIIKQERNRVGLYPMHSFVVGGDDRKFNRRLQRSLVESHGIDAGLLTYARLPMSPGEILRVMQSSRLNICMRFHSVLFAETLGVPYVAIDYTGGGKIEAFLEERGKLDRLITMDQIASGDTKVIMDRFSKINP